MADFRRTMNSGSRLPQASVHRTLIHMHDLLMMQMRGKKKNHFKDKTDVVKMYLEHWQTYQKCVCLDGPPPGTRQKWIQGTPWNRTWKHYVLWMLCTKVWQICLVNLKPFKLESFKPFKLEVSVYSVEYSMLRVQQSWEVFFQSQYLLEEQIKRVYVQRQGIAPTWLLQ